MTTTNVELGARSGELRAAYAACGGKVRKYLSAGHLGPIGHIACLDRCSFAIGEGSAGYWFGRGGPLLAELCALLGTRARDVITRTDEVHGVTEAYVATHNGLHVHFTGAWRTATDSHCLWIEGAKGSLRTDGGIVWWRKRGWRFFVPVSLGTAPKAAALAPVAERPALHASLGDSGGDSAALAVAAVESSKTSSLVATGVQDRVART